MENKSGLKIAMEQLQEEEKEKSKNVCTPYKLAAVNTIKGMGSVFFYGVISVFILVPDLILRLIYYIHDRLVLIKAER